MTEPVIVACISTAGAVVAAALGIIGSWARKAKQAAQATEHETQPNSGHSMRDVIDRIERHQLDVIERQGRMERRLDDHLTQAAAESVVIERLTRHLEGGGQA